jgi:hypothetical protein
MVRSLPVRVSLAEIERRTDREVGTADLRDQLVLVRERLGARLEPAHDLPPHVASGVATLIAPPVQEALEPIIVRPVEVPSGAIASTDTDVQGDVLARLRLQEVDVRVVVHGIFFDRP